MSAASVRSGTIATYGLRKRIEAVRNCRNIGKHDMKFNDATPKMKVDPETYVRYCSLNPQRSLSISFGRASLRSLNFRSFGQMVSFVLRNRRRICLLHKATLFTESSDYVTYRSLCKLTYGPSSEQLKNNNLSKLESVQVTLST